MPVPLPVTGHAFSHNPPGWYGNFLISTFTHVGDHSPPVMWCRHVKFNYIYNLVKDALGAAGLQLTKVTHAFRGSGARIALENGCSLKDVECVGHWNPDKMRESYTTVPPVDALLKIGEHITGFHHLARSEAKRFASQDLLEFAVAEIFPWAEELKSKLEGRQGLDCSGQNFLDALIHHGRDVVLEDLAALSFDYPHHPYVSRSRVARHKDFLSFASKIVEVEERHKVSLRKRHWVDGYGPYMPVVQRLKVEGQEQTVQEQLVALHGVMTEMNAKIHMALSSSASKATPMQSTGVGTGSSTSDTMSSFHLSPAIHDNIEDQEWEVSDITASDNIPLESGVLILDSLPPCRICLTEDVMMSCASMASGGQPLLVCGRPRHCGLAQTHMVHHPCKRTMAGFCEGCRVSQMRIASAMSSRA